MYFVLTFVSSLCFINDIIIYGASMDEHASHLHMTFLLLIQYCLFLKYSKCMFAQPSLEYLGQIVSFHGVYTDPIEVEGTQSWTQKIVKCVWISWPCMVL